MGKIQRLGIVDMETGEILEDKVLFFGKKSKDRNYVKVFVSFLDSIVENDKIAGKAIRLLFYMISKMDYDSLEVKIIPKYAIEELGICRQTFSNWVKDLIRFEIIEKVDRYTYRLKPYTFVKGEMEKAIDKVLNLKEKVKAVRK